MARGISFEGIGSNFTTFNLDATTKAVADLDSSLVINKAVTITGNQEVGFGSDGDKFFGVIDVYEDGYVGVQDQGYRENVPSVSGSVPTYGTTSLVVDGSGNIKASGTVPTRGIIIESDTDSVTVLIG